MMECKDCVGFKPFKYKTAGYCLQKYPKTITDSDCPACKHFDDATVLPEKNKRK